jgi:hypothetical protein
MRNLRNFSRDAAGSAAIRFAKTAAALTFAGVLAAQGLDVAAQRRGLPKIAVVWPEAAPQRSVKSGDALQPGGVTIYRSVGLDGETTTTIPRVMRSAGPTTPYADWEKQATLDPSHYP